MLDLKDKSERLKLIDQINSEENKQRKAESFKQHEIFRDRQHNWVKNYLKGFLSQKTVEEMPIVSSVNLAKRIVKQEASIYKRSPEREFEGLKTDDQDTTLKLIYEELKADIKLNRSNEMFKLQAQNLIQVLPKRGSIQARVLLQHHYDAVPEDTDPERAAIYIISTYDRTFDQSLDDSKLNAPTGRRVNRDSPLYSDQKDDVIADREDWKKSLERYVVWSREFNFTMDGRGDIFGGDDEKNMISPIPGTLPFIDVAGEKDFEYFTRTGQAVTDFSIQYNAAISDLGNVVRMQGWGQAFLIAEQSLIPENVQVGPTFIVKLPVDPETNITPQFGFAQPNADIAGGISYLELLVSNFLSSRGIDPKTVAGKAESQRFSSGIERLLAMIEKFEASQADISIYEDVESQMFELIRVWHNRLRSTDALKPEFITQEIPSEAGVSVTYSKPEMIQTEAEKVENIRAKIEAGFMSRVEAIEDLRNVSRDRALEILGEIEADEFGTEPKQKQSKLNDQIGGNVPGENDSGSTGD